MSVLIGTDAFVKNGNENGLWPMGAARMRGSKVAVKLKLMKICSFSEETKHRERLSLPTGVDV